MSGIAFGRDICGELAAAEEREWLVTNGLGGYASGTIAGSLTRRYHGLLIAALKPPLGRTVLVSKLDETADYDGQSYALASNRWGNGAVDPHGYQHIESFRLHGTTPVWSYAFGDALLEKRIWMQPDANTTYVRYELVRGSRPQALALKALVNYRDYHSTTHAGDWRMSIEKVQHGLRVVAFDGATPFYLLSSDATAEPAHDWYRNFCLSTARYRGLDDHEDHLHAGTFRATLKTGESVTIVLSTEASAELDGRAAWRRRQAHEAELLERWQEADATVAAAAPAWIQQLVLAADQFVVRRPLRDDPEARSVIAGYPWFGDWGRDTMVSLPGLALTTGRPEIARSILRTFARFVDRGMLPNVFPDAGRLPPGHGVGLAGGAVRAGALARVRRPSAGRGVPRADGAPFERPWAGDGQRNLRRRSALHAARLHRAGVDGSRAVAGLGGDCQLQVQSGEEARNGARPGGTKG